ncbi:MAG TPA: DUF1015 domain-containing protein [Acidimicrobiales bacterium]|nr:DUF1015 domain-containing protein [Acidimicrobiales bacterium]
MATLQPFRGLRYDPAVVPLGQVIAPPYDVIGSAERLRLASRHPANSVLVELPEPDLHRGVDRYQRAATLLASWMEHHVVVPDPAPSLYPYRMTTPDGRSTTGVIGALGIGDDVLPHEETLPKPRSDRLDLLRATGANLSPIWGLSPAAGLTATFAPAGPPVVEAYDDAGVRHQLWVVDDPAAVAAVADAVATAPVVVADGHHRYETARAYRREVRAANGDRPGDHDAVMALVVELSEDQLTVGAIHRTLANLPYGTDLVAVFGKWFDMVRAGPATDRVVAALGESRSLALVTPDGAWMLNPKPEAYQAADSDLDSSVVALALARVPEQCSTHQHTWQEAFDTVKAGAAQAAVLLRPVTVEQIAAWASARRRMPPKTTYFVPKPATGMVYRRLQS